MPPNKTRLKLSAPAIQTREEMERLVGEICALTLERRGIHTEMDERITLIRTEYEGRLAQIELEFERQIALARDWAEANPSEFGKFKSLDLVHGTVGWRTGTPKLKTLTGWTWDRVLEALKNIPKFAARYIRRKEEVNKDALIADREALQPEDLRAIGVKVVQDETFFIEPKIEEAPQHKEAA